MPARRPDLDWAHDVDIADAQEYGVITPRNDQPDPRSYYEVDSYYHRDVDYDHEVLGMGVAVSRWSYRSDEDQDDLLVGRLQPLAGDRRRSAARPLSSSRPDMAGLAGELQRGGSTRSSWSKTTAADSDADAMSVTSSSKANKEPRSKVKGKIEISVHVIGLISNISTLES
jgi:hypothetical protein